MKRNVKGLNDKDPAYSWTSFLARSTLVPRREKNCTGAEMLPVQKAEKRKILKDGARGNNQRAPILFYRKDRYGESRRFYAR